MSESVMERLMEALSLHQIGELEEARSAYRLFLEDEPENPNALHLLGVLEYQQGKHEIALEYIERALEILPGTSNFLANLGNVFNAMNRRDEAIAAYQSALEADPANLDARTNLANAFIADGNLDAARAELTGLLEQDPMQFAASNNLGLVLKMSGELEAARELFQRAVTLNPEYFDGFNNLGNVLSDLGRFDEAISAYETASLINPDQVAVSRSRGMTLIKADRLAEAVEALNQTLARFPGDLPSMLALGSAQQELGLLKDAESLYRQVLEILPGDPHALNNLGTLARTRFDYGEALDLFDRAIAVDDSMADAHFNRGAVLFDLSRIRDAEAAFCRACELDPLHRSARESLAILYEQTGNDAGLARVLEEWLSIQPDDPIAMHLAAAVGSSVQPLRCSEAYVKAEFNRAAKYFELRLQHLEYGLPVMLEKSLGEHLPRSRLGELSVLDAGCGTGLSAAALRPWARGLTGVDLSENMLRQAQRRSLYDELVCDELVRYLTALRSPYDLCVALDVFNYFGDLAELLEAVHGGLTVGGQVVFSVEHLDASMDYFLMPNGRFCHRRQYALEALERAGFGNVDTQTVIIRMERGLPAWGEFIWAMKG